MNVETHEEVENKKMGKEIRIIKKDNHKKFEDYYTFIDYKNIELKKIDNENDSNSASSSNDKKHKEHDFKLRNNPKKHWKAHEKRSRLVGGHNTQWHSSVYE
jgi:hypothetical protein